MTPPRACSLASCSNQCPGLTVQPRMLHVTAAGDRVRAFATAPIVPVLYQFYQVYQGASVQIFFSLSGRTELRQHQCSHRFHKDTASSHFVQEKTVGLPAAT